MEDPDNKIQRRKVEKRKYVPEAFREETERLVHDYFARFSEDELNDDFDEADFKIGLMRMQIQSWKSTWSMIVFVEMRVNSAKKTVHLW